MKKITSFVLAIGLFLFGLTGVGQAIMIDIDAVTNTTYNPIEVSLAAGTYTVTAFDGTYSAWTAWTDQHSWLNSYSLSSDEFDAYLVTNGQYDTPELALLNAVSTSFTLTSDGTVSFFIMDDPYGDNFGGISLEISRVTSRLPIPNPEPGTMLLLATGLLVLAGAGRKLNR